MAQKFDGWLDYKGGLHETEAEANQVDGKHELEEILDECLIGWENEVDVEILIGLKDRLFAAFEKVKS